MQNDIRWLILNFPEKAVTESSALEIMFDSSLPSDVTFQLKVFLSSALQKFLISLLTFVLVSIVLGPCQPHRSLDLLPACIWQSSLHSAIRNACFGKSLN